MFSPAQELAQRLEAGGNHKLSSVKSGKKSLMTDLIVTSCIFNFGRKRRRHCGFTNSEAGYSVVC